MSIEMRLAPVDSVETVGKGDVHYQVDNLFGSVTEKAAGPQVFLVHQAAGDTTSPHYHGVPQFQIFTAGGGSFGRHPVSTPALHYADAWTSYGPIVAGDEGIDYFTSRIHADVGAGWMPESRKEKPFKSGRHFTAEIDDLHDLTAGVPKAVIDPHDDGLSATMLRIEPGGSYDLPPCRGSGRLVVVLEGSLLVDGTDHARWSWGHVSEIGEPTAVASGRSGCVVLCCDYPTFECPPVA